MWKTLKKYLRTLILIQIAFHAQSVWVAQSIETHCMWNYVPTNITRKHFTEGINKQTRLSFKCLALAKFKINVFSKKKVIEGGGGNSKIKIAGGCQFFYVVHIWRTIQSITFFINRQCVRCVQSVNETYSKIIFIQEKTL